MCGFAETKDEGMAMQQVTLSRLSCMFIALGGSQTATTATKSSFSCARARACVYEREMSAEVRISSV
jgi:hypothetical protein